MTYHYIVPHTVAEHLTEDSTTNYIILSELLARVHLDPLEYSMKRGVFYDSSLSDDDVVVSQYGVLINWKTYKLRSGFFSELTLDILSRDENACGKLNLTLNDAKRILRLARISRLTNHKSNRMERRFYWCKVCRSFHTTQQLLLKKRKLRQPSSRVADKQIKFGLMTYKEKLNYKKSKNQINKREKNKLKYLMLRWLGFLIYYFYKNPSNSEGFF